MCQSPTNPGGYVCKRVLGLEHDLVVMPTSVEYGRSFTIKVSTQSRNAAKQTRTCRHSATPSCGDVATHCVTATVRSDAASALALHTWTLCSSNTGYAATSARYVVLCTGCCGVKQG